MSCHYVQIIILSISDKVAAHLKQIQQQPIFKCTSRIRVSKGSFTLQCFNFQTKCKIILKAVPKSANFSLLLDRIQQWSSRGGLASWEVVALILQWSVLKASLSSGKSLFYCFFFSFSSPLYSSSSTVVVFFTM